MLLAAVILSDAKDLSSNGSLELPRFLVAPQETSGLLRMTEFGQEVEFGVPDESGESIPAS